MHFELNLKATTMPLKLEDEFPFPVFWYKILRNMAFNSLLKILKPDLKI